jgi:peptide/nickel transport system substrate-binding protein
MKRPPASREPAVAPSRARVPSSLRAPAKQPRHFARASLRLLAITLAAAATLAIQPAHADQKGDCGTLVFPTGAGQTGSDDLTSFSPLYSDTAYNAEASWLLYPNLLWINRFAQIDWSRSLATAVTTTDDQTFVVTMRPWHWSDGVPVTAEDSVYGFQLAKALGPLWPGYGAGGLPMIVKDIHVLSPTQFQITTTHKVNPTWFTYNAISGLAPLPEHAWKNFTLDQMFQLQSTSSFYSVVDGPLKLQRLDLGLDAVFVPNPRWDGPKLHFSRLVFRFLQGDGAAVQGVESGELDDAELPTGLYNAIHNVPGVHVEILPQAAYQNVIELNFRNPTVAFFGDVRVRQAMEDAIDQNTIIATIEHNHGDPAYGGIPRSDTQFLTPAMRAGIYPTGYDLAKSRALLAAAGYHPGPDGIMVKDGKRLSFTYLEESGTGSVTLLDEAIQAQLKAAGIEMKIRQMEFNQMLALMANSPTKWEATGVGLPVTDYPSGENNFATGSYQNDGGYSDPTMDKLIQANITNPDIKYLYDYETYLASQVPVIFEPRERPVILVNNRLHGMADFIDPIGQYAPDQLYCTAPANS